MRVAILTTDNREEFRDYTQPAPAFGPAPDALLQGFKEIPEIEIHVVACVQQPVPSPEKIAPNIFYHSLVVPKFGWMRTLYSGCTRATRKKLSEIQPDIVHGQGTERGCALGAVGSGFPNVVTIHGNMNAIAKVYGAPIGSFHWLAARLETYALGRAGGVLCNSAYTENLVRTRARQTWRVPNALRPEFFSAPSGKNPAARPVILNIGVTEPRKQQLELLTVARRLHERGCGFEFQFAGSRAPGTEYGKAFTRELERAEKAGYARHLGLLSMPQLIAVMDSAAAFVHFPTEEAFGLVAAEALSRNVNLFAADTGGVKEIAENVPGAELFPPTDFTGLENALARWLADGHPTGPDSAELMRRRYHPEVVVQQHLKIYREVLRGRPLRAGRSN